MNEKERTKMAMYKERVELFGAYLDKQVERMGQRGIGSDYDWEMPLEYIPNVREYMLMTNVRAVFYNLFRDLGLNEKED